MTTYEEILSYIDGIDGADEKAVAAATERNNDLLKIPGSLGRIEDIALKLAGITGNTVNDLSEKCIIIMSADNGVVAKGVSSAPQSVTVTMTECFTKEVTGVGVIAKVANADLFVYDIGINGDIQDPHVINKKIRRGTADFSEGPAMSREECLDAIMVGIEAVKYAVDRGYKVIGTGEMGIGNTYSTTLVVCALTGANIDDCVGKGTGMVDDESYINKVNVLKQAMEVNRPDCSDVIYVVSKVGGLDIAGLIGVYIGAAYYKVPVVIDGYISSVAALCAYKLNSKTFDYMFESHVTEEVGYKAILEAMPIRPMFNMNMRLGEGSGCPFTFFAMDAANSMMKNMYTFAQSAISSEYTDKLDDLQF